MEIGTGIAILGVWLFPVACALSKDVTGKGLNAASKLVFILTLVFLAVDLTKLL